MMKDEFFERERQAPHRKRVLHLLAFKENPKPPNARLINTLRIIDGLEQRGIFQNDVLALNFQWQSKRETINDVNVITRPFFLFPFILPQMLSQADIIVSVSDILLPFVVILAMILGKPVLWDIRGDEVAERLARKQYIAALCFWIVEHIGRTFVRRIRVVSRNHLEKWSSSRHKTALIPHGVELPAQDATFDSRSICEALGCQDKFVAEYIGGFQFYQGIEDLVMAMQIVQEQVDDLVLLLVGLYPQQETFYRSMLERHGITNVILHHWVSLSEVNQFIALADVLVLPRRLGAVSRMAAPNKLPEYGAMGKPIIVTNFGDAAALVKEYDCGIVLGDNTAQFFAQGLVDMYHTPATRRQAMGDNARRMVETEFDLHHLAARYSDLLEQCLE